VLFVGTLEPRKNLTTLLQAYAMLCHAWHDHELKLVVAGRAGWLYQDIFTTVKSLGLEEEVAFTGFVEESDLTALYRGAALFVYASLHEGFGLPILEAMACGILVITSNVSSMPEVAGQAAILVEPRRPEVLAAGMASVLGDVQLRDNLRNMGLERPNNSLGRGLRAKCWRCIALA
jgi:glycosyltransferase involved in cell wall biosynthesis